MNDISRHQTITISADSTSSGAMHLRESVAYGAILLPSAFTGTTLTFTASTSLTGTFRSVLDEDSAAVSISITTSSWIALPSEVLTHRFVKVVSDSTEPVLRTMTVVTKVP